MSLISLSVFLSEAAMAGWYHQPFAFAFPPFHTQLQTSKGLSLPLSLLSSLFLWTGKARAIITAIKRCRQTKHHTSAPHTHTHTHAEAGHRFTTWAGVASACWKIGEDCHDGWAYSFPGRWSSSVLALRNPPHHHHHPWLPPLFLHFLFHTDPILPPSTPGPVQAFSHKKRKGGREEGDG